MSSSAEDWKQRNSYKVVYLKPEWSQRGQIYYICETRLVMVINLSQLNISLESKRLVKLTTFAASLEGNVNYFSYKLYNAYSLYKYETIWIIVQRSSKSGANLVSSLDSIRLKLQEWFCVQSSFKLFNKLRAFQVSIS